MKTIPVRDDDALSFFQIHAPVWIQNAQRIGVDPAQAAAFADAAAAAQEAFRRARVARQAAQSATLALRIAMDEARARCGLIIRAVRLRADATGDGHVYTAAQLDAVRDPVRGKPPTRPEPLAANLTSGGGITISWRPRADSPDAPHLSASTSGVLFIVARAIDDEAEYSTVGVVAAARAGRRGVTSFTDTTVPAGAGRVRYTIQPRRTTGPRSRTGDGGLVGPTSNILVVNLGSDQVAPRPARLSAGVDAGRDGAGTRRRAA